MSGRRYAGAAGGHTWTGTPSKPGTPNRKARRAEYSADRTRARGLSAAPGETEQQREERGGRWLAICLEAAVPIWIDRLRREPEERVLARAEALADVVAEKSDVLFRGSKKRGEAAKVFNAVAEALAAGAFVPGGSRFLGLHWEASR